MKVKASILKSTFIVYGNYLPVKNSMKLNNDLLVFASKELVKDSDGTIRFTNFKYMIYARNHEIKTKGESSGQVYLFKSMEDPLEGRYANRDKFSGDEIVLANGKAFFFKFDFEPDFYGYKFQNLGIEITNISSFIRFVYKKFTITFASADNKHLNVVSLPDFVTFGEPLLWYQLWWVWLLLIAGLAIIILIIILIIYKKKASEEQISNQDDTVNEAFIEKGENHTKKVNGEPDNLASVGTDNL